MGFGWNDIYVFTLLLLYFVLFCSTPGMSVEILVYLCCDCYVVRSPAGNTSFPGRVAAAIKDCVNQSLCS